MLPISHSSWALPFSSSPCRRPGARRRERYADGKPDSQYLRDGGAESRLQHRRQPSHRDLGVERAHRSKDAPERLGHASGSPRDHGACRRRQACRLDCQHRRQLEHKDTLFTSSVSALKEQVRADAERYVNYDPPRAPWLEGAWMQGLVGSGDVLAVSRWSTGAGGSTLPNSGLDLIDGGGLRRIVVGADGIVGLVGRLRSDCRPARVRHDHEPAFYRPSEVVVYTAGGKLLKTIRPLGIASVRPGKMPEVVLSGDYLAVPTLQPRLNLYNWRNGKLLHSWRLPSARDTSISTDSWRPISSPAPAPASPSMSVTCGHRARGDLPTPSSDPPPTLGFVGVGIEKPGLAYAWDGCSGEDFYRTLRFVPMARVLAAVSKGHVR